MTLGGVASWGFGAFAYFFMATDVQLNIVTTCAIGGLILIGLGQVLEKLDQRN